jgi:hypothetical protein
MHGMTGLAYPDSDQKIQYLKHQQLSPYKTTQQHVFRPKPTGHFDHAFNKQFRCRGNVRLL